MNLPCIISFVWLLICLVLFVLLALLPGEDPPPERTWIIFALFVLAAATDFVDGYIARKLGQVTRFGRIADPFVDKILVIGTMIFLCARPWAGGILQPWMVVVVTGREFLVSAVRSICEAEGVPFPALNLGKYKMTIQCIAIGFLIGGIAGVPLGRGIAARVLVWGAVALTIISAIPYIYKARRVLAR